MTPEQLKEIEQTWQCDASFKRCPDCGARPHKEYDVVELIAEVRRLNRMVNVAIQTLEECNEGACMCDRYQAGCPAEFAQIVGKDGCVQCWRKYLEEAAGK